MESIERYSEISDEIVSQFVAVCGKQFVLTGTETDAYGYDHTEDFNFPPVVLVKPGNSEEVARILSICNTHSIPVTPIGARTGLSGGALSILGGVGMSMERMNQILQIDEDNLQVTVQPGVITQVLQETVAEKGLFYPVDPASRGSCFIGGNIAENSGGPRALKYGVTKDYVLNLEVVLPDGSRFHTGANTLKNSTGYNLTQLMVGSEGTLAVVTEIVLRLIPLPKRKMLMLVPFASAQDACRAVSSVFKAGLTPSALEFMERDAIDFVRRYVDEVNMEIPDDVQAHLLVEIDGNDENVLMKECEQISLLMQDFNAGEILFADDNAQMDKLWLMRRKVGEAVKMNSVYKEEDTVVPRFRLPELLSGVKEIGNRYGFKSVCYGHAGDGNLHVNILKGNLSEVAWNDELPKAIREIFQLTVSLGGTISGEHGIGYVQKNYMDIAFPPVALDLMQKIKEAFDPNGIMNPKKIFPD